MKQFNANIKELRGKIGWSQEELAREIGGSLSTVQCWEQLGTRPSRLARRELERFLHKVSLAGK
jgi:ribosome-binding protein aMBF1 (putative translation factor)